MTTQNSSKPVTRLLRKPEVLARLGIPKSSWDRGVRLGRFPKPVKIGDRAVAWPEHVIDDFIERLSKDAHRVE